jgi:predicted nucleotidyltransferase
VVTPRSSELRDLAQRIADAIPRTVAEEIVLTGSVSRGTADELSDIEMLVVTTEQLDLDTCFELARGAGLERLGTWGEQVSPARRVHGVREGVPIELIWWQREYAEERVDALFEGEAPATADALLHGIPLRTVGLLAGWQELLRTYPEELAARRIEDAALTWGGFAAAGMLTLLRPGSHFERLERMVDDASRVVQIVFALNRTWQPANKLLVGRVAAFAVKPDRLAERIDEALTEPDPRRALVLMTELQAEAAALAPSGPNIDRARLWLAEVLDLLTKDEA